MLPIGRILCPLDHSPASLTALDAACELAVHFGAQLLVLHVLPTSPTTSADLAVLAAAGFLASDAERKGEAMKQLQDVIREHCTSSLRVQPHVKIGCAAEQINAVARDQDVSLIIMATHGMGGWCPWRFGSVTTNVIRQAHQPVLTIHGEAKDENIGPNAVAGRSVNSNCEAGSESSR